MSILPDTLKNMADSVCHDRLGFLPVSNSLKPSHLANGLFRECTGETCDTRDIHAWIVSERRKNSISSEELMVHYQDILQSSRHTDTAAIREFRYLLEELFNQDNTVYPNYGNSVYCITSHWLLKPRVKPEQNVGRFLFEILARSIDGRRSPAIELIQNALHRDDDDLTRLLRPIIAFPSEEEKRTLSGVNYPLNEEIDWDICKQSIRDGFDHLATNLHSLHADTDSLAVMERVINYAGFSLLFYLVNCNWAQYGGEHIPLLLDAGTESDSIRTASIQCYTSARRSVEDFFTNSYENALAPQLAAPTNACCQQWINEMVFSSIDRENNIRPAISDYYTSFLADGASPTAALAHALQLATYTFQYKNNTPSDFSRVLGVRCGFIGPKGNHPKSARFLVNSYMLETLTLSMLSEEELDGIELKELGVRALSSYNLLMGTDADAEYTLLERANIAQSTPGDLRGALTANAQAIADTYISLGVGRSYADGVTLIGWRL